MKEITYSELRKLQLEILQDVHCFCKNHDINYSLAYGTLLGAVRHGGFIPWDDDIDIAMLRDDYERFAQEYNQNSHKYHFYDCRNDNHIHIGFGKVADTRTMVIEGGATKNLGVSIDVFPIDDLCSSYKKSLIYYKTFTIPKLLLVLKCRNVSDVRKWWKKIIFIMAKFFLCGIPIHHILMSMIKHILKHTNPSSNYVGLVLGSSTKANNVVKRSLWSEFDEIMFEGKLFMTVKDYDTYLRNEYGHYMELPPEKDRIPKHDFYKMYWLNKLDR